MSAIGAILSGTTTIREAIKKYIDALPVGSDFTVKEITDHIRTNVNNRTITINSIPVNDALSQRFYAQDGTFERQTIHYSVVRDVFLALLNSELSGTPYVIDPTGMFKIYTKTTSPSTGLNLPLTTPLGTVVAAAPAPAPAPPVAPRPQVAVKSLAEKILDGTITHTYRVELNGQTLTLGGESQFFSKADAESAVKDKLSTVLVTSTKKLRREIRSLVSSGKLIFRRERI